MLKAMREAKQNTSWINHNTEYETAVSSFVAALLNPESGRRFLDDLFLSNSEWPALVCGIASPKPS